MAVMVHELGEAGAVIGVRDGKRPQARPLRGGEEAALFAAIASEVIWPRMTVCMAVFRPHRPDTTIIGAVTRM